MIKNIPLCIIICLLVNFASLHAQNLHLKTSYIDSPQTLSIKLETKSFQNLANLLNEKTSILADLHKEGYLEAYFLSLEKENDSLYILPIYIGKQTKVAVLKIDPKDWPNKIANTIGVSKSGNIQIPFKKLEEKTTAIHKAWIKHGYSFAEIQLQNIHTIYDTLYADIKLKKGDVKKIDSIIIKGYENFPIKILKHQFGLKPNKRINQEEVLSASKAIEAIGLAKNTRPPEILYEEDKTTVFLFLEKKQNNYFDGIIGFSTNEDTGKLEFYGNMDLDLQNNLNFGEKLNIKYRAEGGEQQDLNVNIETPYIANTPISLKAGIRIFKKDSSFTNTNLNTSISYSQQNWSHAFTYEQIKSTNLLDQNTVNLEINNFDAKYYFIESSYNKTQEDILQPIKTHIKLKAGPGYRNNDFGKESQIKLELEAQHNLKISKKTSLNVKSSLKNLSTETTYYTNELYFIGGIQSIRGFKENSIPASKLFFIQTEYRYKLAQELFIHSITDFGHFEDKALKIKDNLIGFGFGLGLHNKAGVLNIQFANGITGKERVNVNKTRIHLNLLVRF